MSGNDYSSYSPYYSHSQNSNNYQVPNPNHLWGNWTVPPPPPPPPPYVQNYGRNSSYNSNATNHHNRDSNRDRENHNQNHNTHGPSAHNTHGPSAHNTHGPSAHNTHGPNAHGPNNHMLNNHHPYNRPPPPHGFHDSSRLGPGRLYYRKNFSRPNTINNHQYHEGPLNVENPPPNWQPRHQNNFKRARLDSSENEPQLKTSKKKKKSLSQNIPNKKDWTLDDAQVALMTEKEHNKKSKNALIIKFPDQELNKDIVAQFHSAIENVHFQQPCTPRFCFVTLQESAEPSDVISVLNKQKFGEGFLSVEHKKDREEDQAVAAGDIDPLTLYVGNLAQEITKEDMVSLFPSNRRIDIGYAKKMKFTRYAFVGFRTVADSIEAFKNTYNKQMYNKSLIVRFRRLHGTVGMPGESKPQNPPKNKDSPTATTITSIELLKNKEIEISPNDSIRSRLPSSNATDISTEDTYEGFSDTTEIINTPKIKREQDSEDESFKDRLSESRYSSSISADLDDYLHFRHSPLRDKVKQEVTTDNKDAANITNVRVVDTPKIKTEPTTNQPQVRIKDEPYYSDEDSQYNGDEYYDDDEYLGNEDAGSDMSESTNFSEIYATIREHQQRIEPLKKT